MFFRSNIANYALYAALLGGVAVLVYFLVTKLLNKGDKYDEEEGFFGFFDKKKGENYDEDEEDDYDYEEEDEDDYEDEDDEDDYEDDEDME
jgi:hypothetical protein